VRRDHKKATKAPVVPGRVNWGFREESGKNTQKYGASLRGGPEVRAPHSEPLVWHREKYTEPSGKAPGLPTEGGASATEGRKKDSGH